MAGYIFALDSTDSLIYYVNNGVYATKVHYPRNSRWMPYQEGTYADYASMRPGDNVYFFIQRKIYGIGELVLLNDDCKFNNYPQASEPAEYDYQDQRNSLLLDEGGYSIEQRWVCFFKPSPYFFINGLDMDDVLASNPKAFKMLRAFWKLSFIKFDDEENQAFKSIILKANEDALINPVPDRNIFNTQYINNHRNILNKLNEREYTFDVKPLLRNAHNGDRMSHEMALEAGIITQIFYRLGNAVDIFGTWDYLSHQVVASPFKPIDYMDKMDVFGYRFIENYPPTISKYLLMELKKDEATIESVEQTMKYVDWIKEEYSYGDYGMINTFLVAYDFSEDVVNQSRSIGWRRYIIGRRPALSLEWRNLKLIRYRYNNEAGLLHFQPVQ